MERRRPARADARGGGRARDPAAEERTARRSPRAVPAGARDCARTILARCTTPACSRISRAAATKPSRSSSESLALEPDQADGYSNLGIVLQSDRQAGRGDRRLPPRDRDRPGACERPQQSRRAAEGDRTSRPKPKPRIARPSELNPDHIDAYTNLGILLNGLKRTEEAAACYCKVITLRPKHREARRAAGAGALHARRRSARR